MSRISLTRKYIHLSNSVYVISHRKIFFWSKQLVPKLPIKTVSSQKKAFDYIDFVTKGLEHIRDKTSWSSANNHIYTATYEDEKEMVYTYTIHKFNLE